MERRKILICIDGYPGWTQNFIVVVRKHSQLVLVIR
jgi:hypothetical protein